MNAYVEKVLKEVEQRNQGEALFLQAVKEVLESISPVIEKHKEYQRWHS